MTNATAACTCALALLIVLAAPLRAQVPCPPAVAPGKLLGREVPELRPRSPGGVALAELRREPDRRAAPGYAFFSVAYRNAPAPLWRRFALDSGAFAYRIAGFDSLDLEVLACRLEADSVRSTADVWRAVFEYARALSPFEQGHTYLPGVSASGVPTNPRWTTATWDSTGFPHPDVRLVDTEGLYEGRATVDWSSMDGRTHLVEWRFRVRRDGRLAALRERLLAGKPGRRLAWPPE